MRHFLTAILLLISLPADAAHPAEAADKPLVLATFSIIADMARNVAGDAVEIHTLLPADADAHTYDPTPQDIKKIADARLILANGLGFEPWLARLVKSSRSQAWVVNVSKDVKPIQVAADEPDPHAWQDVSNAKLYVLVIRDALIMALPSQEHTFRHNADDYIRQLDELDSWARNKIAHVPEAQRRAITSHDALGYFAKAYGITFIPAHGVSTGGDLSAKTMASLIEQMRRRKVNTVFLENMGNPKLMEQLARDGNATIGGVLFSDALTASEGAAPTYILMIKHNVDTIVAAIMKNLS